MDPAAECRSSFRRLLTAVVLAFCVVGRGAPARAQAPSCGWGDGVVLPGGDARDLVITDDGGSGVIAVTWPLNFFQSELRFYHVLEQGKLDPSLPATGVTFLSGPDFPSRPDLAVLRALPDGAGGAYVLFYDCNSTTAHLRCWETAEIRLLRVTSQGTAASGWPLTGLLLDVAHSPVSVVDLVPAGAPGAGVIVAWIAGGNGAAPPVQAQRFAPDGSTVWPGGVAGLSVLDPQTQRSEIRVASDHAGGCVVVAVQAVSNTPTQRELRAGRVDAAGALPWGAAGKPVFTQPGYSMLDPGLAVDELGRSFITTELAPIGSVGNLLAAQLLSASGNRAWGIFGTTLGSTDGQGTKALAPPTGYVSLHTVAGTPLYQLQDGLGNASWGDGVAADWTVPPSPQLPLSTPDGHVISVWQSQENPPNDGIRALELDENGAPAPGWPGSGALICGGLPGHFLEDALIAAGNLFVALAASDGSGVEPLVQRLTRAVLAVPDGRPARALEFAPPEPNPARGAWLARVSLGKAGPLAIEAFDVAGRRVLAADVGALAPGWHVLDVPGSGAMAPGVYRVRVRSADHVAERVLVKLR